MMTEQSRRLLDQLDAILENEHDAVLTGEIGRLAALVSEKERLVDALNALAPPSEDSLRAIQGKLARNQALLDGALHGIRTVAARLAAHRRIRRSLDIYDQSGRKQSLSEDIAHNFEKRA